MPYSGRLSTLSTDENINNTKEIILENRPASVRHIARELNLFRLMTIFNRANARPNFIIDNETRV